MANQSIQSIESEITQGLTDECISKLLKKGGCPINPETIDLKRDILTLNRIQKKMKAHIKDMRDKITTATAAYLRKCKSEGTIYQQPTEGSSTVKGDIVKLKNINGLIAVYDCKKQRFISNETE